MARQKDTLLIIQRKHSLLLDAIRGRTEASSTQLSASFGLSVEDVRRVLQSERIQDNG